jgi:hypothetical protein
MVPIKNTVGRDLSEDLERATVDVQLLSRDEGRVPCLEAKTPALRRDPILDPDAASPQCFGVL